jgi:hypothetical protein
LSCRARLGLIVAAAAATMPAAAVRADAAAKAVPVLEPSGSLLITWQGSEARGCRVTGECGVTGSLAVHPDSQIDASESPPQNDVEISDGNAVARVTDPRSSTCADQVPVDLFLNIVRARSGHLRATVEDLEGAPSSGRCAGPTAVDLANMQLPAVRRPGPLQSFDLTGKSSFGAGPFVVTIKSTLRVERPLHVGGGAGGGSLSGGFGGSSSGRRHTILHERVAFDYRLLPVRIRLMTSFHGRPDPLCLALDACGESGSVTDAISIRSGIVRFQASRRIAHPVPSAVALRDLRAGRLQPDFPPLFPTVKGHLTEVVGRPGSPPCQDQLDQGGLSIDAEPDSGGLTLSLGGSAAPASPADLLRTRCPGPSAVDVFGSEGSGTVRLALRSLRRDLVVVLPLRRSFASGSYAGTTAGSVALRLQLVRVTAGTQRVVEESFP